jgi:aspartate/methionine/tyrosine aminotransferase
MDPAARVLDMVDAPVDSLNQERRRLESEGRNIINLGQAIPDFGPPLDVILSFRESLKDDALHRYTPDSGLAELRAAVAASLGPKANGEPVSADEIIITAGANHAFMVACAALINDGDAVGLLSPYFLNHIMTVQGIGGRPIELLPDESFAYTPSDIERAIKDYGLKVLTIVNPSNPTGKSFSREEVAGICDACRKTGAWIFSDEVYRRFDYSPAGHTSVLSIPETEENAIVIGSFSKEFGMTGWRVGWIRVPRRLVSQFLKVQDYSIICASHPGQIVALNAMRTQPNWAASHLAEYNSRRQTLLHFFQVQNGFQVYGGQGAIFTWFRPHMDINSQTEVLEIMKQTGVCVMPGSIFGKAWTSWFRISYGTADIDQLMESVRRIVSYFENY